MALATLVRFLKTIFEQNYLFWEKSNNVSHSLNAYVRSACYETALRYGNILVFVHKNVNKLKIWKKMWFLYGLGRR